MCNGAIIKYKNVKYFRYNVRFLSNVSDPTHDPE